MHEVSKQKLSTCRFSYIAICCLSLLHRLDKVDVEKAVTYVISCKNMDGGFGCTPGAESHAGQSMLLTKTSEFWHEDLYSNSSEKIEFLN